MVSFIVYLLVFAYSLCTTGTYETAGLATLNFMWYWEIFWTSIVILLSGIAGVVAAVETNSNKKENMMYGALGGMALMLLIMALISPLLAMSLGGVYVMYHALIPFNAINFTVGFIMWLVATLISRVVSKTYNAATKDKS